MNSPDSLELAYGLYRYENPAPKRVDFIHVRDLTKQEFDSAGSAIGVIDEILRGFDVYLDTAVRELQDTVDTLKSDLRDTNRGRDHTSWAPTLE